MHCQHLASTAKPCKAAGYQFYAALRAADTLSLKNTIKTDMLVCAKSCVELVYIANPECTAVKCCTLQTPGLYQNPRPGAAPGNPPSRLQGTPGGASTGVCGRHGDAACEAEAAGRFCHAGADARQGKERFWVGRRLARGGNRGGRGREVEEYLPIRTFATIKGVIRRYLTVAGAARGTGKHYVIEIRQQADPRNEEPSASTHIMHMHWKH